MLSMSKMIADAACVDRVKIARIGWTENGNPA